MDRLRSISISAALFVLVCFFLPWVQVSCLGARDSASGLDLARSGERELWLVPLLMLAIVFLGINRFIWKQAPAIFALAGAAGGALSAWLIYRKQSGTNPLIAAQWTVWFWLAIAASICIAVASIMFYARRLRPP
jgi:hypothetical protein